jgi:4,5-dihydroxyphthalate decarboxylase
MDKPTNATNLKLTFACGPYDRMDALRYKQIQPEGIDLEFLAIQAPRVIFDKMVKEHAFDVSELSASEFISMTGAGKCPFVALPVFPSKAFRHNFVCINTKAGIKTPKDLEGKRVGTPLYTQTAMIFIRGHLQHDYGVDLSKIHWVQGALEHVGSHGSPGALPLLKPVPIEINDDPNRTLSDLLAEGKIDATMGSRLPTNLFSHPNVARLWPNFREVERDFYKRTKIHPIMHLVAIRREVYDKNPWIAGSLYRAFQDSKKIALDEMKFDGAQRCMLPWLFADLEEIEATFPNGDPWPYGIEPNRPTLEALMTYMVEQHFIPKAIPIDELFVKV